MSNRNKHLIWILALLAAVSFDFLFWNQPGGINFFIFVLLATLAGLIPFWLEKEPLPWSSYLLLIPAFFFALMTSFRAEPLTNAFNVLITLGSLALFWITLRSGSWFRLTELDHGINAFRFGLNSLIGGLLFFFKRKDDTTSEHVRAEGDPPAKKGQPGLQKQPARLMPLVRGILIAIPIIIVLTVLLASADLVFQSQVSLLFDWIKPDNLTELAFRTFYVISIGYILLSAYAFGRDKSREEDQPHKTHPFFKPFLGSIEAAVVLSAVSLLFLVFVILQFAYLFGGADNISQAGFTYADYARRGFFELVTVAVISLFLFYGLALSTKRTTDRQRRFFSGLGMLLFALVGVILFSAFTRLNLYANAYGFTRLRALTLVFIFWMAALLIALVILETRRLLQWSALALIIFIISLGLVVNVIHIDQFIVRENLARAFSELQHSEELSLDTWYLNTLSHDAVPPLVAAYNDPATPPIIREEVGGMLACRLTLMEAPLPGGWQSFHYSRNKAYQLLQPMEDSLREYLRWDEWHWVVRVNGEEKPCFDAYVWD